jgi:cytochrome oxidase Cu insertion factor (SCO1/SenC/PrrC family)
MPAARVSNAIRNIKADADYNAAVSIAGKIRFVWKAFRGGKMLNVGDEAPDFEVTDHRGRKVALHDLRGRKVVLWFYPKADTPG